MREDFTELKLPDSVSGAFPPSRDGLFHAVRAQTDDSMLKVVAECDYGMDADKHFTELKKIRDGLGWDEPMEWEPNEVLQLYRWSDAPDESRPNKRHEGELTGREFHIARAFCCCALLRVADHNENRSVFSNDSLAPLIDSCLHLGRPYGEFLARYLTWSLAAMEPWDEDYLYHGFGLLAVLAQLGAPEADVVGEWIPRANDEIMPWHAANAYPDAKSFIDLRFTSISGAKWRRIALQIEENLNPTGALADLLRDLTRGKTATQRIEDLKTAADTARVAIPMLPSILRTLRDAVRKQPKD